MASHTSPDSTRINITICGDGGCGKSSITLRLVKSAWTTDYDPTIEDSYSLTRSIGGTNYHLSLTDTAGQEEYRSLASTYSRSADAFVLVYDITNPASLFEQLPYFVELIQMESENRAEAGEVEPVMLVAGNKCDLKDERRVTAREGLEWARAVGACFMETSARSCVNIEESFAVVVRKVVEAREMHHARLKGVIGKRSDSLPDGGGTAASGGAGAAASAKNKKKNNKTTGPGHQHGDSWSKTQPLPPLSQDEYAQEKGAANTNWLARLKCW